MSAARGAPLLDLKLADLQQSQYVSLREIVNLHPINSEDTVILLSFFEPNCPWCYRQMKVFNRIEAACQHSVQPMVVGINGDARALRKEIRKAKVKFPALKANKQLMEQFSVPATPLTLVIDSGGEVLTAIRGYIPLKDFADLFKQECDFEAS